MKKILLFMLMLFVGVYSSYGSVELKHIQFDPSIISAGDEVDIIIQYIAKPTFLDDEKLSSKDYTFDIKLYADDDMSKNYVTILDSEGDDLKGSVISGELYNKVFRVKVHTDALKADYEFKLIGTWYKNGLAQDLTEEIKFKIPVKKEGIILDVSNIITTPTQVKPGDKYVEIITNIENVGEKAAKSVEVTLESNSNLIEPSYSNNNRIWVGRLNSGESKETKFYLNLDEYLDSGLYELNYKLNYLDVDDNSYEKEIQIPFLVKPRSYLEIIEVSGDGLAGSDGELKVYVKNTGTQSAESVDVRILKQDSQPFNFDIRSSYIGELEPNQSGVAIFNFDILNDAEIKEHNFKILIRSKGDSDEGDDSIYTYNRNAKFEVIGKAPNNLLIFGSIGLIIVLVLFGFRKFSINGGVKKK